MAFRKLRGDAIVRRRRQVVEIFVRQDGLPPQPRQITRGFGVFRNRFSYPSGQSRTSAAPGGFGGVPPINFSTLLYLVGDALTKIVGDHVAELHVDVFDDPVVVAVDDDAQVD